MPGYENWSAKMDIFAQMEFIPFKEMIKSLYRAHNKKSSSVALEEAERLESLKVTGICGRKKRFPDDGVYVSTSFWCCADIVTTLNNYNPNDSAMDAKLALLLYGALAERGSSLHIIDQEQFERYFKLRWKDGSWRKWLIISVIIIIIVTVVSTNQ